MTATAADPQAEPVTERHDRFTIPAPATITLTTSAGGVLHVIRRVPTRRGELVHTLTLANEIEAQELKDALQDWLASPSFPTTAA